MDILSAREYLWGAYSVPKLRLSGIQAIREFRSKNEF